MVLQARAPGQDEMLQRTDLKVGFTVSRKVGGAVTRNRVRRRLKAVAECVMPGKAGAGQDYVVIGRRGAIKRPFELLKQDMEIALRRLGTGRGTRT